jgi:2-polyprenyl-6-methoxyphenol hydroxylase-like FAD-dependent oxidoreductase
MQAEVAIVGGGPVGLGLAIDLGQRGVTVAVLERSAELHRIPKGQNLTQRTMEHFRVWGVEERVRAARKMPPGFPAVGVNAFGHLLGDFSYPWFRRSDMDRFYFASNERLPQYATERILRERVAELPTVTMRLGAEVASVSQQGLECSVAFEGGAVSAQYVVGCDGSRSVVRRSAGIGETRTDHDRRMVLLVFRSSQLFDLLHERFGDAAFFNVLDPELDGYWRFLGAVDARESWFFHAPVDPVATAESLDCATLLHQSVGAEFEFEIDYVGFWDLRVTIADTYRSGRVFIAGDAAHSHPPYGGYGINTGFEDARNLAWKLAADLQGWAGPGLLDTYTPERRSVFASTAGDFIERLIENDRAFIAAHDPGRDRAEFADAWERRRDGSGWAVTEYAPHYEGSALTVGGAGATSAVGHHELAAQPGHHLAPTPGFDRSRLEQLGAGLALVTDRAGIGESFVAAAGERGVPLRAVEADMTGYATPALLVRPDHFVSWVGGGAVSDPAAIIEATVGLPAT